MAIIAKPKPNNTRMIGAPILANIDKFFSGGIDPSTPHVVLILLTVVGGLAVGSGIIWEAARGGHLWTLPTTLVFLGVVAEAAATVVLFEFDEGITHAQQSKIIALEERIAPRVVTEEQYAAIQTLRGKIRTVSVLSTENIEPAIYSAQLQEALTEAGIAVTPVPAASGERRIGITVCLPGNENTEENPLWKTLATIGLDPAPVRCSLDDPTLSIPRGIPRDAPLVIVGDRALFWPNGKPKSFRMRMYPGFGQHP